MRRPPWVASVVIALLATVLSAQQTTAPPLHVVLIDAIPADRGGQIVKNLKASDFEVREDGVPWPVESVAFGGAEEGGRLFAIFLDEYHVGAGTATGRARDALARFVDTELGPTDLIVVMKPLDSLFTIRPSRDREAARRTISSFEGRRGDYAPRSAYEKNFIAGDPDRIESARLQVVVSAIDALAVELGPLSDARKTIIVVTEALGRPTRSRGREYLATLDTAIRAANKSRASIYVVDPRESSGNIMTDEASREAIDALTRQTDGEALAGGDLQSAMRRIGRDSAAYYLLTYRSPHKEDGAFHPVAVRVKRPGVVVRARAGYWAPSPDDALRRAVLARASQPEPVRRAASPRRISPLIRPWVGVSRADSGKTRVTFVWEPAARIPGDRPRHTASRVELTVVGADEAVIFEGAVLPTGPASVEELQRAQALAVFEAPAGRVRLQMKIEDERGQQIDSDVREVAVRDWRAAVAIGTPEILRARNARERRALDSDLHAVPVASREFSRTEQLLIRFPTYAPEGISVTTTAKLLGHGGRAMRELPVDSGSLPDSLRRIDVPLAGLAPGNYTIELVATSPAGDARDRFDFRVTN